jgi:predicted MFS family arabinose efflux permease
MQIGSVILIIGGALCSGAVDLAMFLVGRFIAGWGAGVLACVVCFACEFTQARSY